MWSANKIVQKLKDPDTDQTQYKVTQKELQEGSDLVHDGVRSAIKAIQEIPEMSMTKELHNRKKAGGFLPIVARFANDNLQGDIADVSSLSSKNKGFKYLLVMIDVYSRYGWVIPQRRKTAVATKPNIIKILDECKEKHNRYPRTITFDNGGEFQNNDLAVWAEKNTVHMTFSHPYEKHRTYLVERFIKTIRNLLRRWIAFHGPRYEEVLPFMVDNYNRTNHRGILTKPINLWNGEPLNQKVIDKQLLAKKRLKRLQIGTRVRYFLTGKVFSRGKDKNFWSKAVFEIIAYRGWAYLLQDKNHMRLTRAYPYHMLQVVDISTPLGLAANDDPTEEELQEQREIQLAEQAQQLGIHKMALFFDRNGNVHLKRQGALGVEDIPTKKDFPEAETLYKMWERAKRRNDTDELDIIEKAMISQAIIPPNAKMNNEFLQEDEIEDVKAVKVSEKTQKLLRSVREPELRRSTRVRKPVDRFKPL